MAQIISNMDGTIIYVYSDGGKFLWSYNIHIPKMRFGIQKEKTIGGYKFIINDDGSQSMIWHGNDQ